MLKRGDAEIIWKCRYLPVIWTLFLLIAELTFNTWVLAASVPAMLKGMDIVYYIDFPWYKEYRVDIAKGCHRFFLHSGSAVLRCEENISLLRPLHIIKAWQRQQSKKGFFSLTINEFNIKNVHGYIKKIKSISLYALPVRGQNTKFMTVTGRFIRHVNDVRKYQFRNRATGKISSIRSTPNHPFYLKNRGSFIPIEAISPEDEMIQRDGQVVKLIDPATHCSASRIKPEKSIALVYNLEVSGKHTYFAGQDFILVHNPYTRKEKNTRKKKTVKGKHKPLKAWQRYKLFVDSNCIEEIDDPNHKGARTLAFKLSVKDRVEFMSKHGFSSAKSSRVQIRAAISDPLRALGFKSWSKATTTTNGMKELLWKLENRERFADAIKGADIALPAPPPLPLPPFPDGVSELSASNVPGLSHFDTPAPLYSDGPSCLSYSDPYLAASPYSLSSDGYYQPPLPAPCLLPDF